MMRLRRSCFEVSVRALLAAGFVLAFVVPVAADHCEGWNGPVPEAQLETPAGLFYVDNDLCQPECAFSVWVYEESNGMPGLQRDDAVVSSTCHGMIAGDRLVVGGLGPEL